MTDATSASSPIDLAVTEVMTTGVPTVQASQSVPDGARVLLESGLSGVPVLDGEALVGLLTDFDLVAREAEVEAPAPVSVLDALFAADAGRRFEDEVRQALAVTVGDLMTAPVATVLPMATLGQVATLMADRHLDPVPVVDVDGRLLGVVSRRDIIRVVAEYDRGDTD